MATGLLYITIKVEWKGIGIAIKSSWSELSWEDDPVR